MNSDLIGSAGECKHVTNIFVTISVHVTQTNPGFLVLSEQKGFLADFFDANNSFICISAFVHVKQKLSESLHFCAPERLLMFMRGRQNNGKTRRKQVLQ